MYNAWAAYDDEARQTVHGVGIRLPRGERDAASQGVDDAPEPVEVEVPDSFLGLVDNKPTVVSESSSRSEQPAGRMLQRAVP